MGDSNIYLHSCHGGPHKEWKPLPNNAQLPSFSTQPKGILCAFWDEKNHENPVGFNLYLDDTSLIKSLPKRPKKTRRACTESSSVNSAPLEEYALASLLPRRTVLDRAFEVSCLSSPIRQERAVLSSPRGCSQMTIVWGTGRSGVMLAPMLSPLFHRTEMFYSNPQLAKQNRDGDRASCFTIILLGSRLYTSIDAQGPQLTWSSLMLSRLL